MNKLLLGAALAASFAAPAAADLLSVKTLSGDMVGTMLSAALKCAGPDANKVTVVIVDRTQNVILTYRGPLGTSHTVDLARLKANSVVQFGRPSGPAQPPGQPTPPPAPGAAPAPATLDSLSLQLRTVIQAENGESILGGGLPIKAGDETIAGIGLSNAGPIETKCAQAAIDAITGQLK